MCGPGRRSTFLVALSFYCLLSVAGIAADVQVNAPDHNFSDQGKFTSQSETSVAVAGSLVVVGYNSTKQVAIHRARSGPATNYNSISGYAFSTDGGANFTDGGLVPANGNRLKGDPALAFGPDSTTLYYASIGKEMRDDNSRIFVSPSTSLGPRNIRNSCPNFRPQRKPNRARQGVDRGGYDRGVIPRPCLRCMVGVSCGDSAPNGPSRIMFAASSSTSPLAFSLELTFRRSLK